LTDNQARDHLTKAELALDEDGKFLAMRVATLANLGAYLGSFAPAIPTWCYGTLLAGNYATPAIYVEVKGVFTNTAPVDAYRGAGRPEACYVVERLVDRAAREMRLDPVVLRRRNFIPNDAYPYTTPVALTYDSGDYFKTLDMAVKTADYASFEQRRKGAAKRGKLRGIGISTYIEACAMAPSVIAGQLGARAGFYETAEVRAHPTGSITVFTGSHSHGQGHETTFAQLVADRFGVPLEMVDKARSPSAWGPTHRARLRWAVLHWSRPWIRSSPKPRRSPPICSRLLRLISSSPTANSQSLAQTAPCLSLRWPSPPMSRTIIRSTRWSPA
jgi:carbon-monoxide dehydrogenase large subunit